jgi:hypothetical protein
LPWAESGVDEVMCESVGCKVQLVVCECFVAMDGRNDCGMSIDYALERLVNSAVRNGKLGTTPELV